MKTHKEEIEEMIDAVIKLTWNYTVFRALFEKNEVDCEARQTHPEFFLTMHDTLFCGFCVMTELLFEKKAGRTSLCGLIGKAKPDLANRLTEEIRAKASPIEKIEAIRYQVCTHRFQAKSPKDVFAEASPRVSMMTEVANLARFVILELVGEVDGDRKAELEKQQLSESTLRCVANDADQVMRAFRSNDC